MDTYVELLVEKKGSPVFKVLKIVLIVITALLALYGLAGSFLFLIIALGLGGVTYLVYLNGDIEYEYLYVDKELSVDKIMAKSKRKKVETLDLERLEMLAPLNSYRLAEYKNRNYKVADYSSGVAAQPEVRYALFYNGEKKIILEPNAELVTAIRNIAPRKVFTD